MFSDLDVRLWRCYSHSLPDYMLSWMSESLPWLMPAKVTMVTGTSVPTSSAECHSLLSSLCYHSLSSGLPFGLQLMTFVFSRFLCKDKAEGSVNLAFSRVYHSVDGPFSAVSKPTRAMILVLSFCNQDDQRLCYWIRKTKVLFLHLFAASFENEICLMHAILATQIHS